MAKISTYPADSTPSASDYLIGTDVNDANNTKSYTIGDILSVPGSSAYVPYTGASNTVNLNTQTFLAGAAQFTSLGVSGGGIFSSLNVNGTGQFFIVNTTLGINMQGVSSPLYMNSNAGGFGYVLRSNGAGATPSWVQFSSLYSNTQKGLFFSSTNQSTTANQNTAIVLDNTTSACTNGISVVSNGTSLTRITFTTAGQYRVSYAARLNSPASGTGHTANFWLRKNDTGTSNTGNIPMTGAVYTSYSNNSVYTFSGSNIIDITAGDYIELMWRPSDAALTLAYTAIAPTSPSAMVTISQV